MKERNPVNNGSLSSLSEAREVNSFKKNELIDEARRLNELNYIEGWVKSANRRFDELEKKNEGKEPVIETEEKSFIDQHGKKIAKVAAGFMATTGIIGIVDTVTYQEVFAVSEVPSRVAYDNLLALNNTESSVLTREENEYSVVMDVAAQTVDGRTQVPVRFIAENMGCKVDWDGSKEIQTVTVSKDNVTVVMRKNKNDLVFSKIVTVNGVNKTIDVPAQIIGSRTCVPIRFLSENLGFGVDYDNPTKEVTVLEPENTGKILVAKLGSKEVRVMQNTYESGIRRAAFFADPVSRKDLLDSLKTSTGPVEPPSFIFDEKSGAQINYLSNNYNDKFETDEELQADFTARFANKTTLGEDNTCYSYADKLVVFTGVDKKHVNVFTVSSGKLETIASTSDISNIVVDPKNENNLIIKNSNNEMWVNGKWEAPPVVITEAEKLAARKVLYGEMQKVIKGDGGFMWRNGVKMSDRINLLHFDKQDVENYLKTGVAKGFEAVKGINGLDVGILMNNEFGLGQNKENFISAINWLKTNDPTRFNRMVKSGEFYCSNFGYQGLVEKIGVGTWNSDYKIIAVESTLKKEWGQILSIIYVESLAIEYNKLGWSIKQGGIEKGKQLIDAAKDWLSEGLISQNDYKNFEDFGRITIDYYEKNY